MRGRGQNERNRVKNQSVFLRGTVLVLSLVLVMIAGCNSDGTIDPELGGTQEAIEPSEPLALDALCGDCKATISWETPENNGGAEITGFIIYRGIDEEKLSVLTNVEGNVFSYCDETAENGTEYFYTVSAMNEAGEGTCSSCVSTVPRTTPGLVLSLDALGGDGVVNLSWTSPTDDGGSDILSFHIYRGTVSGSLSEIDSVLGTVNEFSDTTVVNGTTYYYTVTAKNAAGEGDDCGEVSEMPHPDPTVPSAPQNFAVVGGNAKVDLSWTAPASDGWAAITDYNIYRQLGEVQSKDAKVVIEEPTPQEPSYYAQVGATATSYTDNEASNGTAYTYYVCAVNSVGEGQSTGLKSATPMTTPGLISSLQANAGNAQVALSWNAPSNNGGGAITDYKIYRRSADGRDGYLGSVGSATTSYTDETALNDTTYYYSVSAVNAAGEGSQSEEVSATPEEPSVPSAPSFSISSTDYNYAYFTWSAPESNGGSEIIGYKIYAGTTTENMEEISFCCFSMSSPYGDVPFPSHTGYYFAIAAYNANGVGEWSTKRWAEPGEDFFW